LIFESLEFVKQFMKRPLLVFAAIGALSFPAFGTVPEDKLNAVPVVISQSPPEYPLELRKKGLTGSAVVEFIVGTNGEVVNAYAVSAMHLEFAQAAVDCVHRWKFKPAMRNGRAVNTRLQVPVGFTQSPAKSKAPADKS
jgi:TonB family protein